MKKALFCLACLFCISTVSLRAQNPARPNSIYVKRLFIDHHTPMNGDFAEFSNYTSGFEAGYLRNLSPYLNFVLPMKVGVMKLPSELNNRKIFGLDGQIQLQYFKEDNIAVPYALVGLGGVLEDFDDLDFQIPFGIGVNFKMGKFGYINLQSEYRKSLTLDRSNFQHGIGIGFMLGKYTDEDLEFLPIGRAEPTDSDSDGVPDKDDECPDVAGLSAFAGCPDTDDDGITDADDECPEVYGQRSANGCPDTDGDTVADKDDRCPNDAGDPAREGCPSSDTDGDGVDDHLDECPNMPGKIAGCPDTDGDGIVDKKDACPFAAGEGRFNGCPDTDKDGIEDSKDRCPNEAAPNSPNGCPIIEKEDREVLDYAIQAVQFEFGSSVLKPASFAVLDQVYDVLMKYPDFKLSIIGHTDNVGTEERNLNLSSARARACYDYLNKKGVITSRMGYGGFGESRPIADNETENGRKLNRRVEFNLGER